MFNEAAKPNIILLGVGHSGTTIVARMLFELGWNRCDADQGYAESSSCRHVNHLFHCNGVFEVARARKAIADLEDPWIIKDPRFVFALEHWRPLFRQAPLLVWLRRDLKGVKESYHKRNMRILGGALGYFGRPVEELFNMAKEQYEKWDGAKVAVDYESIGSAVRLFRLDVNQASNSGRESSEITKTRCTQ